MKYKVEFEFMTRSGEWKKDDVSFNGTMTHEEALYWCQDFNKRINIRNAEIIELK